MKTLTTMPGLPGLALPDRPAAPRPDRLLEPGCLLLAGVLPGHRTSLARHRAAWPPVPHLSPAELVGVAQAAGLRGHGGAGFPLSVKLGSIEGVPGPVVVNGSEGESASAKDGVLLTHVPHLVLDGAVAAAMTLGAGRVVIRLSQERTGVIRAVRSAVAERDDAGIRFEVSVGPESFVAGEATAVLNALSGRPAVPAALGRPPKARSRFGRSRPVLLSNVETFARLAAALAGAPAASVLLTVSGAVDSPGVLEVPATSTVGDVLDRVRVVGMPRVLVTGGWHGAWVSLDSRTRAARVTRDGLAAVGGRLGAGALIVVPDDVCPVAVAGAVARHLAAASAGQCGPCVNGLHDLADAVVRAGPPTQIQQLADEVTGRGLCGHPGAAAAALLSASRLLAEETARHRAGHCGHGGESWRH